MGEKKCMTKPMEGEFTPQYKDKILDECRPSEARFLRYGFLMIKENVQNVHLDIPCTHYARQTYGNLLSSTTSNWVCLPWLPMKYPSRAVARCGSAD
jgi:hypothetical protein